MTTASNDTGGGQGSVNFVQEVEAAAQSLESDAAAEDSIAPPEAKAASVTNIEERLKRLEEGTDVEFIRREVRFVPAVVNLWRYFRPFGNGDDPRSRAALTALLWRLFSPGSAAAAGGLLMLGLTAAQVLLISQQNQKLDQQTYLAEASRRGALTAEFAALSERIGTERTASMKSGAAIPWKRFNVDAMHFKLEESTLARLSAFTRSAKAYHYLDLDTGPEPEVAATLSQRWYRSLSDVTALSGSVTPVPRLNSVPLSPERGQVLSFLSTNAVDLSEASTWGLDFSRADLRSVQLVGTKAPTLNLARADLSESTLSALDLAAADLRGADLRRACWQEGDLSSAQLKNADLRGAYVNDVALPTGDQLAGVLIDGATNLSGSYSFSPKWLDQAREQMQPDSRPHLNRYKMVEKTRTFVMHDYAGKAEAPEDRKIYILEMTNPPPLPRSCALLPGA